MADTRSRLGPMVQDRKLTLYVPEIVDIARASDALDSGSALAELNIYRIDKREHWQTRQDGIVARASEPEVG